MEFSAATGTSYLCRRCRHLHLQQLMGSRCQPVCKVPFFADETTKTAIESQGRHYDTTDDFQRIFCSLSYDCEQQPIVFMKGFVNEFRLQQMHTKLQCPIIPSHVGPQHRQGCHTSYPEQFRINRKKDFYQRMFKRIQHQVDFGKCVLTQTDDSR